MAYNIRKISPIDLKPSVALGVSIPFSSPVAFSSVYTTKDQLKYNIINFLLTNPRERVFDPLFGAGLRASLFEQIDMFSFEDLKQSIRTKIENNFPQIEIKTLNIVGNPDYNSISINFSYRIINANENDNVNITVQSA